MANTSTWQWKIVIRAGGQDHHFGGTTTTAATVTAPDIRNGLIANLRQQMPHIGNGEVVQFEATRIS
jgi:hypothetical protein